MNCENNGFKYGLVHRPAGVGCIPNESHRIEASLDDEEGHNLSRHGVVVFGRPLTESEICSFELSVIANDEIREEMAVEVAKKMARYAKAYVECANDEPALFLSTVREKLRTARKYRVYVGLTERFAEKVKSKLEIFASEAQQ